MDANNIEEQMRERNESIKTSIKESRDVIDNCMKAVSTSNNILQSNKDTAHYWAGKINFGGK
jgi:predicted P-loop ATPase/GTPase